MLVEVGVIDLQDLRDLVVSAWLDRRPGRAGRGVRRLTSYRFPRPSMRPRRAAIEVGGLMSIRVEPSGGGRSRRLVRGEGRADVGGVDRADLVGVDEPGAVRGLHDDAVEHRDQLVDQHGLDRGELVATARLHGRARLQRGVGDGVAVAPQTCSNRTSRPQRRRVNRERPSRVVQVCAEHSGPSRRCSAGSPWRPAPTTAGADRAAVGLGRGVGAPEPAAAAPRSRAGEQAGGCRRQAPGRRDRPPGGAGGAGRGRDARGLREGRRGGAASRSSCRSRAAAP